MNRFGPSWIDELIDAGVAGLPFSWTPDGTFAFEASMTDAQRAQVLALFIAHDSARESRAQRDERMFRTRALELAQRLEDDTATSLETREAIARLLRRAAR